MAEAKRYPVHTAETLADLEKVLQDIATLKGHVRIVSIMKLPGKGYVIVSEIEVLRRLRRRRATRRP